MWSRVDGGLVDGRPSLGAEAGEHDRRLHLRAGDWKRVLDPGERAAFDDERQAAVGRGDRRSHLGQRVDDPPHRAAGERLVAGELEAAVLEGEDPGDEAHERAGVAAVERCVGRAEAAQADAADDERVDVFLIEPGLRARGRRRGSTRCRLSGPSWRRVSPLGERADQEGPMRDGLVARNGDVAVDAGGGLDPHSTTGETTTP